MSTSFSGDDEDDEKDGILIIEDDDYETNDDIKKKRTVTLKVKCYFETSKVNRVTLKIHFFIC